MEIATLPPPYRELRFPSAAPEAPAERVAFGSVIVARVAGADITGEHLSAWIAETRWRRPDAPVVLWVDSGEAAIAANCAWQAARVGFSAILTGTEFDRESLRHQLTEVSELGVRVKNWLTQVGYASPRRADYVGMIIDLGLQHRSLNARRNCSPASPWILFIVSALRKPCGRQLASRP